MAYKPISRKLTNIKGYIPRYTSTEIEEEPVLVASPLIIDDNEVEDGEIEKASTPEYKRETYSGSRYNDFVKAFKSSGVDSNRFDFFAKLASKESGFNPTIQNQAGAPAYGYFQFMQGSAKGRTWDNITRFAGVDTTTFRNNPILQIQAASKLADSFMKGFTQEDIKRARELGYTDSALLAGAWLGGVGGVRKLLHSGKSVSDRSWSSTRSGTDMRTRMQEFNNMFRQGGIIKAQQGAELKSDNRNWFQRQLSKLSTNYRNSTWANSAPAQVLAMLTAYGIPHYLLGTKEHGSDPTLAAMSVLPTAVIVKDTSMAAKTAAKGLESIYNHYGDLNKYANGTLKHLWNTNKTYSKAEMSKVPERITAVQTSPKGRHDYSFFTDSTGTPTLNISSTATDPFYAGQKAGGKQIIQKLVFSTADDAIKPFTAEQQRLLTSTFLPRKTVPMSPKDAISRLMTYKTNANITSSFEELTEQEAKKLFEIAYDDNFFATGKYKELSNSQAREQYWDKYKDDIKEIFKRVPVVAGPVLIIDDLNTKDKNEKEIT